MATAVEKTLFAVPMADEREATVRAYLEGGLSALAVRDPVLRVAVLDRAIRVGGPGGEHSPIPLPGGWEEGADRLRGEIALAVARAVGELRRRSPALAALPPGTVEELFLRGALGRIDPEGLVHRARDLPPPAARPAGSVGLVLHATPAGAEVIGVLAGSPADEAGIERGALLLAVDGRSTAGLPAPAVEARLQGELGSRVQLEVRGRTGRRALELSRRRVVPVLGRPERLGAGLVWLRPHGLAGGLGRVLLQAVRDAAGAGAVLDLRGNPGGPPAVVGEVAGLFVERGRLYAVAGRDPAVVEKAGGETPLAHLPLVVLVDEATAGSAELLAASLQDHRRAAVVGSRTAGRGVIQVTHELGPSPDDLQIRVTAGRLARPGGARIQGAGVQPDLCTTHPQPSGSDGEELPRLLALPRGDCPRRRLEPPPGGPDREVALAASLLRSPALLEQALRRPPAR